MDPSTIPPGRPPLTPNLTPYVISLMLYAMVQGPSGRVVIVVEPTLKRDLYVELARRGLTLKTWFVGQATRFVETSRQPSLFTGVDTISPGSPRVPSGTPPQPNDDTG